MVDDQKVIDWKYDEKAPQKLGTQTCFTSRKKTPRKKTRRRRTCMIMGQSPAIAKIDR
jgi:hypothetical protein